jgi:flagellar assembly protein FliH
MTAQRFTFDRAFPDTPQRVVPLDKKEPTITVSEHERLLAMAVAAARQDGLVAGQAAAENDFTAELSRTMTQVAMALELVRADLDGIAAQASAEALRFGHEIGARLAGRLIDDAPIKLIEDAARRIFEDLRGQPHVAVRVADPLLEAARERIQAIAREKGFDGRLIVMGEPDIAVGDVRIEWADGGIVRDRVAAELRMAEAVAQAFAAARIHQAHGHGVA